MHRLPKPLLALGLLLGITLPVAAEAPTEEEQILQAAQVGTTDKELLDFFRRRTLTEAGRLRIEELVRHLGHELFAVREAASNELSAAGSSVNRYLERARQSTDLEVVRRAEECLKQIKDAGPGPEVPAAAVRLLALRRPAGALDALLNYLPFVESEALADDVRGALTTLVSGDAQPNPVLVAALTDPLPDRRAGAAVALCRAGDREPAAVRKLLGDPDATVRLHAALALAAVKEKEAVPVLIELLAQLPPGSAWLAEDVLLRLADGGGPTESLGSDAAGRRCRDAWLVWWRMHGPQADLSRVSAAPPFRGYTLVVLLDQGRIQELDADGKPRLQIDGLSFPLDAQWLPGDRVLVAEYNANRVTERDCRGAIRWQKPVEYPLVAQRLASGHTFIATRTLFLELDRDGKEVAGFPAPNHQAIMKALKLPNGDIACVTTAQKYYRLDATGRERASFDVALQTSGGRLDVLPNGNVLVPQMNSNLVLEIDPTGKVIWQAAVDQPVAAVRLANGDTLVTSLTQRRALELDRDGKPVWEFKADTRINRAWRR